MATRLEILKASLAKKQSLFDQKSENHFADVRQYNDVIRVSQTTLKRWNKQNAALNKLRQSIELTIAAIEDEEYKFRVVQGISNVQPIEITELIEPYEV